MTKLTPQQKEVANRIIDFAQRPANRLVIVNADRQTGKSALASWLYRMVFNNKSSELLLPNVQQLASHLKQHGQDENVQAFPVVINNRELLEGRKAPLTRICDEISPDVLSDVYRAIPALNNNTLTVLFTTCEPEDCLELMNLDLFDEVEYITMLTALKFSPKAMSEQAFLRDFGLALKPIPKAVTTYTI